MAKSATQKNKEQKLAVGGTKSGTGVSRSDKAKRGDIRAQKRQPVRPSNRGNMPDKKALAQLLKDSLVIDANTGKFKMSNAEFNQSIGQYLISHLNDKHIKGQIKGVVETIPKSGRGFVIGDLHNNIQNLVAIMGKIQKNKETNLDKNPNNKIIFLGDMLSTGKESPRNLPAFPRGGLWGESLQRYITWLRVRYPDQVFVLNGNHEVDYHGRAHEDLKKPGQLAYSDPVREAMIQLSGSQDHNGLDNDELHYEQINLTPLVITAGNRAKGEKTRVFQHAPNSAVGYKTIAELESFNNPLTRFDEAVEYYKPDEDELDEASNIARRQPMAADLIYCGHLSSRTMNNAITRGDAVKTDTSPGLVGEYKGGVVYVDSQAEDERSGYVEIDFDNDNVPDKTYTMKEVLRNHHPSKLEKNLIAAAVEAKR